MIELNMKFNSGDLFIKEPSYAYAYYLHPACITVIAKKLLGLSDISFYCRCHYAGEIRKISFMKLYFEEYDFDEEISF